MRNNVILFLIIIPLIVSGQHSVSGRIIDSMNVPIPFAVVALEFSADSSIVQGKITDENGLYIFTGVRQGNYFLKINATGYETSYSAAIVKDSLSDYKVPDIRLGAVKLMDAVTIAAVAPTIEFKGGNITVNIENSALAKGNSVYDLLSKLPGVSIENNSITLQGKAGVIVMIDGRVQQISNELLLNLLKGMNAATIQKIEIMKNPPVKYDAAGTSGMINIVTKRSEQVGYNGSAYLETSQGIYNNTFAGVALNYKNEKISVFTGIDISQSRYGINNRLDRNLESDSGHTEMRNVTDYQALVQELMLKLGADWHINKSTIIGIKMDGGPGVYAENGLGTNHINDYNNTGFDHLIFTEDGDNTWNMMNYNFNAEHHFDTSGTSLSFSTDFTNLHGKDHGLNENYFYDAAANEVLSPNIYQNTNRSAIQLFSSRFDFTHPLDSANLIEAGIKGSYADMANEYLMERKNIAASAFYTDSTLSSNYIYREQNLAAYFNFSKSGKIFNFQAGLRVENTSLKGRNSKSETQLSKSYLNIFPTISLEYHKSEDHIFQVNVNRRIDRPSFEALNPFIVYRDQYSYFSGNPFLQPHYSNTAGLSYSYKGIINNAVSYSRINDFMLDYTEQNDTTKVLLETNGNIDFLNSFDYLLFIKYAPAAWLEISFNGTASYLEYKGEIAGAPFRTKGLSYRANLTSAFVLRWKTKLEITGLYRGPNLFGITRIDPLWTASFALQRSFFSEKLDCTIGMQDIFKTMKFHTHAQFDNQDWDFYHESDSQRFTLSVSYNFGKIKAEEREMSGNEEEKERLGH